MQVMSLRKANPTDDGCFVAYHGVKSDAPVIWKRDTDCTGNPGIWQALDKSKNGFFSAVSYKEELLNSDDLREEAESRLRVSRYEVQNLARLGKTNSAVTLQDETMTINGLVWRHRLTATYENVTDLADVQEGTLSGWRETYEYAIDSEHVLRRTARYSAEVVDNPDLIDARRALTRKLVEAVHIEKLTQAEVDVAVAKWDRLSPLERPGRKKGP